MTEAEWNTSIDLQAMLESLRASGLASDRKLRLFACACCRRIWSLLYDDRSRRAVEVAERHADGLATWAELDTAEALAEEVAHEARQTRIGSIPVAEAAEAVAFRNLVVEFASGSVLLAVGNERTPENLQQCLLLRDIFGLLPFRSPPLDPSVLAWNDGCAVKLATAIYEERAFDRMPVLGDALEDAGLTDQEILEHCRGPGPHARGCWLVDLLTGRQ
jgi:hypothetical protein